MLIITAKFTSKPECREDLIELARNAVGPSNNEEGCIIYEFLQDPFNPDHFTFLEKWRSRQDLELHFEETHFKEFAAKVPELTVGEPILTSYEIESESKL
jgi:quinol monooxygenase YgiN